jgi:TrmH family RNA methyltransferase
MTLDIVSVNNPRVKQWSQLLDKKGREKQGKFIVEGIHLVQEAIRSGASVECVVYSLDKGIPPELLLNDGDVEWIGVSDPVFAKCTDTQTPQGVFAVVIKREAHIEQLFNEADALLVAVDGVQDPGNLGTIVRSADAVKATGILLGKGTVDLFNPKAVRATMGSLFHLPIVECDLSQILPIARQRSIQVVNTSLRTDISCYDADYRKASCFILGNEGQGVSEELLPWVDVNVKIPLPGKAESLNVAMAGTILLYEALRQRLAP